MLIDGFLQTGIGNFTAFVVSKALNIKEVLVLTTFSINIKSKCYKLLTKISLQDVLDTEQT